MYRRSLAAVDAAVAAAQATQEERLAAVQADLSKQVQGGGGGRCTTMQSRPVKMRLQSARLRRPWEVACTASSSECGSDGQALHSVTFCRCKRGLRLLDAGTQILPWGRRATAP